MFHQLPSFFHQSQPCFHQLWITFHQSVFRLFAPYLSLSLCLQGRERDKGVHQSALISTSCKLHTKTIPPVWLFIKVQVVDDKKRRIKHLGAK